MTNNHEIETCITRSMHLGTNQVYFVSAVVSQDTVLEIFHFRDRCLKCGETNHLSEGCPMPRLFKLSQLQHNVAKSRSGTMEKQRIRIDIWMCNLHLNGLSLRVPPQLSRGSSFFLQRLTRRATFPVKLQLVGTEGTSQPGQNYGSNCSTSWDLYLSSTAAVHKFLNL